MSRKSIHQIATSPYIGKIYGRLTIIEFSHRVITPKTYRHYYICRCECGTVKTIRFDGIKSGAVKSCGCWNKEIISTHRMTKTPEYKTWNSMKHRCLNSNNHAFSHYGGRGITVCDRWLESFENFLADMGKKSSPDLSIERRDNNAGYSPDNCYYATRKQQADNRRTAHNMTLNGITQSLANWSIELKISEGALRGRLRRGWSEERTLSTPLLR